MKYLSFAILVLMTQLAFSQAYEPEKHYLSLGLGLGGDQPNTLWIADEVTGANLATQTTYDLRLRPVTVGINYQYGLHEYISIGAYLSPSVATAEMAGYITRLFLIPGDYDADGRSDDVFIEQVSEKRRLTSVYLGIKGEFHFAELIGIRQDWDLYAGLSLGANLRSERVYDRESVEFIRFDVNTISESSSRQAMAQPSYTWRPDGNPIDGNVFVGARYFLTEAWALYAEAGVRYRYLQVGVVWKFDENLAFGS
ncbi:MAG: hypothetical protein AAF804_10660 [Bacteroidota bacterium]